MNFVRMIGIQAVQHQLFYTKKSIYSKCFQAIAKSSKKRKCDLHEISSVSPKAIWRRQTTSSSSSSSFEEYSLQVRHKQDWGRGFILLLLQTAALPGSDAGSDVIKPASSFVIQNRQTSCSMWCPMYRARC